MPACARCGAELVPPFAFCERCGAPSAAAPAYPAHPYYPPPRKDNTILIIVIVVVLVIAIPTILAGVLYIMVSGLIGQQPTPGVSKPVVTFGPTSKLNNLSWSVIVAAAAPPRSSANYRLNVEVGTNYGTAVAIGSSGQNVTIPGLSPTPGVRWTDVGGDGAVNGGDGFTIAFDAPPAGGTALAFYLIWSDGSVISSVTWQA